MEEIINAPTPTASRPVAAERTVSKRLDVPFTVLNLASTAAAVILPFYFWSVSSIIAFFVFYTLTGLGLTMGYHRLFAHHAYVVPKWLEYTIALFGYLAIQRGPIFWSAMHRMHHKYTDVPGKDPHSPKEGLWHVHFGWIQMRRSDIWTQEVYKKQAPDLYKDPFYRWLDHERHDYIVNFVIIGIAYGIGGLVGAAGPFDTHNALCWLVWVGLLNRVALLQAFALINSLCHMWGSSPYRSKTDRTSTNNLLVALLIFGEGWHNNHHAFPKSARHGLRWFQVDVAWYTIWLLKTVGLAKNVSLPDKQQVKERQKKSKAFKAAMAQEH